MKRGIASALIIAVVLIGGASWYRFAGSSTPNTGLTAIDKQPLSEAQYEELLANFLNTDSTATSTEPLTATDLISRQMFIDYLSMARAGEASTENVIELGEKYADNLTDLIQPPKVTILELKISGNSSAEIASYIDSLNRIYYETTLEMEKLEMSDDLINPKNVASIKSMVQIYEKRAVALKAVPTPPAFLELQLELINNVFLTAWSFGAISETTTDPALGISGLISLNESSNKEASIFTQIEKILERNGS